MLIILLCLISSPSLPVFEIPEAVSVCCLYVAREILGSIKGRKCQVGQEREYFFAGVQETVLVQNLLRQSQTQTLFLVWIIFPQGTGGVKLCVSYGSTISRLRLWSDR